MFVFRDSADVIRSFSLALDVFNSMRSAETLIGGGRVPFGMFSQTISVAEMRAVLRFQV
jgi:hypothetical protein